MSFYPSQEDFGSCHSTDQYIQPPTPFQSIHQELKIAAKRKRKLCSELILLTVRLKEF